VHGIVELRVGELGVPTYDDGVRSPQVARPDAFDAGRTQLISKGVRADDVRDRCRPMASRHLGSCREAGGEDIFDGGRYAVICEASDVVLARVERVVRDERDAFVEPPELGESVRRSRQRLVADVYDAVEVDEKGIESMCKGSARHHRWP
jgi:hypothetical protein